MSLYRNLGDVSDTIMGQAPPSEDCNKLGEGVPFVKAGEFGIKRPIIREWTTKPLKMAKRDDILICVVGATSGKINKGENCAIGRSVAAIRVKQNLLDVNYLYYFLKSWSSRLLEMSQGAAQTVITKDMLYFLQIPLPSLPQQQKIANILDAADALIQNDKALIAKYDELTQALFLDMFGDPVSNFKGWEKVKLEEISKISSGSTPNRDNESYYDGEIPWVKTGEVNGKVIYDTSEKISKEALKNSSCKLYPKGSLIIAMYGQGKTRGQIGMLGIDATTNQACGVMPPSEKMNFKFLFHLLQLNYDDLRSLGRGGNQPNLNSGLLKNYEVFNPPIKLQNQFAERVAVIEEQKAIAQKSLAKSEELFNSLLQKAFKGELE